MSSPAPPRPTTLTSIVRASVQRFPATRLSFAGAHGMTTYSLAELHTAGRRLADGLWALGVRPGDAVVMQLPNLVEAAVTFVATAEVGVTLVPISHSAGSAELHYIVRESGAKVAVVPDIWRSTDYVERLQPHDRPPTLEHVIVVGDNAPTTFVKWSSIGGCPGAPRHDPQPAAAALLLYTSGTTGQPKGVIHTQATLAAEVAQTIGFNGGSEGPVALASFPVGHMAGILSLARAFGRDTHTIFMDAWEPDLAARLVAAHRVTSSSGTPFHLLSLFDAADAADLDLGTIHSFLLGATMVSPTLVHAAGERGIMAFRCYGSTEHPTVSSGHPLDDFDDRAMTDGRLLPDVEVRVVDDDDRDVAPGGVGEILSRGPDRSVGYTDPTLDDLPATAAGWYRSGDMGRLDSRGYLTIVDRKKDLIIRGGENIASREVEDVLMSHPAIREAAVVGSPDDRYGERLCAIVVSNGPVLDLGTVRRHFAAAGLSRHKVPELLVSVDDLPRTPSGKVQKHVLRAALADGRLSPHPGVG